MSYLKRWTNGNHFSKIFHKKGGGKNVQKPVHMIIPYHQYFFLGGGAWTKIAPIFC